LTENDQGHTSPKEYMLKSPRRPCSWAFNAG
jgi:hypothetical protein